jgi:hypothetical protein
MFIPFYQNETAILQKDFYNMCHMPAEGNKRSSSRLTSDEWPWTGYPPHLDGASLVLSGRTILPLLAAFQTTPVS